MTTIEDMAREAGFELKGSIFDPLGAGSMMRWEGEPLAIGRFAALVRAQEREEFVVYMWLMDGDLHGHAPRSYGYTLRASDGYTQEEVDKRLREDPTLKATPLYALKDRT